MFRHCTRYLRLKYFYSVSVFYCDKHYYYMVCILYSSYYALLPILYNNTIYI